MIGIQFGLILSGGNGALKSAVQHVIPETISTFFFFKLMPLIEFI